MNGSCNEYGFKSFGFLRRRLEKEEFKALTQVLRQLLDGVG